MFGAAVSLILDSCSLSHEAGKGGKGADRNAGGITNGNDLVAAYARLSGRFPGPVAEMGLVMTDTGDRPQLYGTGKVGFTMGIVWQVLKAMFMGIGKSKTA